MHFLPQLIFIIIAGFAIWLFAKNFLAIRQNIFLGKPEDLTDRPAERWRNLFLAGDWTATGLPATIEGAIRSGNRAAGLVTKVEQVRPLHGSGTGG